MNNEVITLKDISFSYEKEQLFHNLNSQFSTGQIHCLVGPSGVGKSSLLKIIAGLPLMDNESYQGSISVTKGRIAYMAQDDALMPWLSVWNNVLFGYHLRGEKGPAAKARQLLAKVGLAGKSTSKPKQLSGGERQRAALVRTLLEADDLILLDEPFSRLDFITRMQMHTLVIDMFVNKTLLMITHDISEALRLADHIYIMKNRPATLEKIITLSGPKPRSLEAIAVQEAFIWEKLQ